MALVHVIDQIIKQHLADTGAPLSKRGPTHVAALIGETRQQWSATVSAGAALTPARIERIDKRLRAAGHPGLAVQYRDGEWSLIGGIE